METRPSETAILGAVLRAAHQVLDGEPKILRDEAVMGLVPGSDAAEIRAMNHQWEAPTLRHLRSSFVSRSRYAEDELAVAVREGVEQLVILGAGIETFAHRRPAWAQELRIIEVDHPASQAFKASLFPMEPAANPSVEYYPIDFESTGIAEGLSRSSFDNQRSTFFWWLGVLPYLTEEAIDDTLAFVRDLPAVAHLVVSFVLPDASLTGIDLETAQFSASAAGSRGEPWLSRFDPEALVQKLEKMGFVGVRHQTADQCHRRYYEGRDDRLEVPRFEQLVSMSTRPSTA